MFTMMPMQVGPMQLMAVERMLWRRSRRQWRMLFDPIIARYHMHRLGAYLYLERLRADEHARVQAAVAVGLGRRDVVLERARQRGPASMHLAEDLSTAQQAKRP